MEFSGQGLKSACPFIKLRVSQKSHFDYPYHTPTLVGGQSLTLLEPEEVKLTGVERQISQQREEDAGSL
jgi:hypothetical protein